MALDFLNLVLTTISGSDAAVDAAADAATESVAAVVSGTDAGAGAAQQMPWWTLILLYGGLFLVMYLLLIRPQSKRRKAEEQMRNSIEVGDEITTIGGIVGRVVSIKDDDSYIIETGSDRAKMKIKKWAIGSNDTVKEAAPVEEKKGIFGFFKKKTQD